MKNKEDILGDTIREFSKKTSKELTDIIADQDISSPPTAIDALQSVVSMMSDIEFENFDRKPEEYISQIERAFEGATSEDRKKARKYAANILFFAIGLRPQSKEWKDAKRDGLSEFEIELSHVKSPVTAMSFGHALKALKEGNRVARQGWNGKGMWLSLSCDGSRQVAAENLWSPHNAHHAREQGGFATVLPSITMKTATGEILMGWIASQTDMLADDWIIVED